MRWRENDFLAPPLYADAYEATDTHLYVVRYAVHMFLLLTIINAMDPG
jgi:hypothetical protein